MRLLNLLHVNQRLHPFYMSLLHVKVRTFTRVGPPPPKSLGGIGPANGMVSRHVQSCTGNKKQIGHLRSQVKIDDPLNDPVQAWAATITSRSSAALPADWPAKWMSGARAFFEVSHLEAPRC